MLGVRTLGNWRQAICIDHPAALALFTGQFSPGRVTAFIVVGTPTRRRLAYSSRKPHLGAMARCFAAGQRTQLRGGGRSSSIWCARFSRSHYRGQPGWQRHAPGASLPPKHRSRGSSPRRDGTDVRRKRTTCDRDSRRRCRGGRRRRMAVADARRSSSWRALTDRAPCRSSLRARLRPRTACHPVAPDEQGRHEESRGSQLLPPGRRSPAQPTPYLVQLYLGRTIVSPLLLGIVAGAPTNGVGPAPDTH